MNLTNEYKKRVIEAVLEARENFGGSDAAFSKQLQIHNSVYSRLKSGQIDGLLSDAQYLTIGRMFEVSINNRKWNFVKTDVVRMIEEEVLFCKKHSKARILVDEPEIGKTQAAKYLSRTLRNCFYLDCSQAKTKKLFVSKLARAIGVDQTGKISDILENVKYSLKILENPIVILDEAGDVEYSVILIIKELWNSTENICGWYMMGADGLKQKFVSGISSKKVGFRELFSRYSSRFSTIVPMEKTEKIDFYKQLLTEVLAANTEDKAIVKGIVQKCLVQMDGNIGGLRRAESLLILNS